MRKRSEVDKLVTAAVQAVPGGPHPTREQLEAAKFIDDVERAIETGVTVRGIDSATAVEELSDVGRKIRVVWGEETLCPVQYNAYRIGPFEVETIVQEGETIAIATQRAHRELAAAARAVRDDKLREHLDAIKRGDAIVRDSRGR